MENLDIDKITKALSSAIGDGGFSRFKEFVGKNYFHTRVINTKEVSDPIVEAIQAKDIPVVDPSEISEPIVEALSSIEETIRGNESVEVSLKGVSLVSIKGDKGENGKDGDNGKDGKDGYTPVKFKDYFTKEEIEAIIKKIQKSIKVPKDGEDGKTPVSGVDYPSYDQIKGQVEGVVAMFPAPKDGLSPAHEWNKEKTQVRFQLPSGEWGEWSAVLKAKDGQPAMYGGGGASAFIELSDVPQSYSGHAGKFLKVNSLEKGLEFGSGDGVGDTLSPATNTDSYIPQWAGDDSKTLKNGIPVSTFAPALGDDDNYVTDAEKTKLSSLSGTNTGDQDLTPYALLAGRSGGQTLVGGTGVTDVLKLQGTSGNGTSTSPAVQVKVGNNGGTTAMTVLNNGNVGIGTTSPTSKLQVVGLPTYADNTAALAGGLTAGAFYRTSAGVLMVTY